MSRCRLARLARAGLLALAALAAPGAAQADERILAFDSNIAVRADGGLEVTETLRVRAEGTSIRRGIYRDFPTRYTDRYGNRVVVDFQLLGVQRDGSYEPSFVEQRSNGVRINTGDDRFLRVPAEYTYTIRYRTSRQLGFFPDHDELYWNVTGLGWEFPIDAVQARVTLPAPVPSALMRIEAYTGRDGEQGRDYRADSDGPGVAVYRTTRTLNPGEGLTIVDGFPKGMIPEPAAATRLRWFLHDNGGALTGLASLALLAAFYVWRWLSVGRDPAAGPVFPRYEPPAHFAPAELRALRRLGSDRLCFTADVVDMGVRGFLRIHEGSSEGGWRLEKLPGATLEQLAPSQRVLAASLFKDGDLLELKDTESSRVGGAISAHAAELSKRLQPRYFQSNRGNLVVGIVFSAIAGLVALKASGGNGLPLLALLAVLAVALHVAFGRLLKAPTTEGRRLMDEIEGLKLYLGVAERDELAALPGPDHPPPLDARRYEALLPFAIALEVEQAWTDRFTRAVGVAIAQQATPGWYHSSTGRSNYSSMGSSIGSALGAQISSSASPPGSGSGGGGGGSSGGGGGGGGGGGR